MKRISIIFSALLMALAPLAAQNQERTAAILSEVAAASASMKSFACDFRQVQVVPLLEEDVISTGKMDYRSDGRIMWKYETPKLQQIAITADKIITTSESGSKTVNLSENPMMAQVRELLLGVLSGKQFETADRFECSASESGRSVTVDMVPKPRQLKKLFSKMSFTFASSDKSIEKVVLFDADGGSTTITFTNKKINR